MVEAKDLALRDQKPVCRLERVPLDLSDRASREALFARIGRDYRNVLVITEGLIYYLSREEAGSLADDLRNVPSVRRWIQDYSNLRRASLWPKAWIRRLRHAPLKFDVPDWLDFFAHRGWAVDQNISFEDESIRIGRPSPIGPIRRLLFRLLPRARREAIRLASGCVMLKRDGEASWQ